MNPDPMIGSGGGTGDENLIDFRATEPIEALRESENEGIIECVDRSIIVLDASWLGAFT
ncbi:hypothetical protein [Mesorhizobium sp. DCY119]|uniref:hypothetical protein n=1 Tax=Mesorhizobium sp. DCY119 TaxID=2108445 RepID=UPI0013C48DB8|nr:hypothetical protein [Mesorhizobium sp. DCY119]